MNVPAPRWQPAAAAFARALAVGGIGGWLASIAHLPLPWLLGSLLPCAFLRLRGVVLGAPPSARAVGQWVIGTALGLYFTPAVVARLAEWAPWIALAVAWSFALGTAFAWALARWGGADGATAFWSGAIGAASEMVIQGERAGARVDLVAAAHSLRVMLVVVTIPLLYDRLGLHGADAYVAGATVVDPVGLAKLVAATVAGAFALRALRGPNPWALGPLAVALALTANGIAWSALPRWVIDGGQLLIGISLGTRFAPGFFARAPRFLAVVAVSTIAGMAASAGFGALVGLGAGIPLATMVLATSPGGIAEMSLTAKVLQLGVPVVTAFHATRLVALLLAVNGLWRLAGGRLAAVSARAARASAG